MKGARLCAIFSIVSFLLVGTGLLFFSCIHNSNYWSFFIALPCLAAFISPAVCYNYDKMDVHLLNPGVPPEHFATCREFGWVVAGCCFLFAYCIPIIAWYNSNLPYHGVVIVFGTLTSWCISYVLWLKVVVF
jgi:hypothetical protein